MEKNSNNNQIIRIQNSDLTEVDKKQAIELANSINLNDESSVTNFGINTQKRLGDSSTEILNQVKTKDTSEIGNLLGDLLSQIKGYDVSQSGFEKFMSTLPVVNKFYRLGDKIVSQHKTVETNLLDITERLDKSRLSLSQDNLQLKKQYDNIVTFIKENKINIEALKIKMGELKDVIIPQLQNELQQTPDQIKEQELSRVTSLLNRLEKKVYNMELFEVVSLQSMPRLVTMAENNIQLVSNIENTIQNVIPLWKQQIAEALYLDKQKEVVDMQDAINELTNKMIVKNSQTIKENTIKVSRQMEKGIVDITTIQKVNKDFSETITEVMKIRDAGIKDRQAATIELTKIKTDMANSIRGLNAANQKSSEVIEITDTPIVESLIDSNK